MSRHQACSGCWVPSARWLLKPDGALTLIWRADGLDDVLAALKPEFGAVTVLPVLPRPDKAAIRVLVSAVKVAEVGGQGGLTQLPPLALNDAAGQAERSGGGGLARR